MSKPAVYTSLAFLAALLLAGPMLKSQSPAPPPEHQWEYASVTSGWTWGEQTITGGPNHYLASAKTCFGFAQGCRSSVTTKIEADDVGSAMLAAASALGDDRWELVSVASGASGDRVMYFRRPKGAQR